MNCLIKKKDLIKLISHMLSGKTYTFHMNMLLILLNYHSINVSFYFQGAYCTKYTVLNKKNILKW